jgi:K+/H+ antiporter YhaU regulatory subunit KhtT
MPEITLTLTDEELASITEVMKTPRGRHMVRSARLHKDLKEEMTTEEYLNFVAKSIGERGKREKRVK